MNEKYFVPNIAGICNNHRLGKDVVIYLIGFPVLFGIGEDGREFGCYIKSLFLFGYLHQCLYEHAAFANKCVLYIFFVITSFGKI